MHIFNSVDDLLYVESHQNLNAPRNVLCVCVNCSLWHLTWVKVKMKNGNDSKRLDSFQKQMFNLSLEI